MTRVAEEAGMDRSKLYPHALRATAATYHAYHGLPATALQSFMGWGKISAANKYVRLSGKQTAKALHTTYGER
ncbi:tyrosine-type recombinase/integrase [Halorarum salinum]|uniref:Tyrosine-type recombinase/integrase n=1 Tax=Halorarum salinum TaxID=2743089 RepID=A0A7D5L9B2_9EURY|nr:tyrosine-type recombinase/integrase [Halobaculum salinum]